MFVQNIVYQGFCVPDVCDQSNFGDALQVATANTIANAGNTELALVALEVDKTPIHTMLAQLLGIPASTVARLDPFIDQFAGTISAYVTPQLTSATFTQVIYIAIVVLNPFGPASSIQ